MNVKEMEKQIEELKAENAELKAKKERKLSLKVAQKSGGVSLYGIHSKFPVTMYAQQWEKVLNHADAIRAFIEENRDSLSFKE